ncbi:MAG: heavy-metal-associated domain-containing protein [Gammaproteobacteria bacterium]|jgi:copper chaperone CopZ|nr:heavy-metal-associated domain-containing protein [Gammaproteobacteria bacterium]
MTPQTLHFLVQGLRCGGCEASAKDAVSRLPGYVDAVFDHQAGTGVVRGEVDPQSVVEALAKAGYRASPVASP